MTPLEAALAYAARGWPVFPCSWHGPARKRPLTRNGFHEAATDLDALSRWWRQWHDALIGAPTGAAIGAVVLDIDVKDDLANGWDTLEDLGHALPDTPTAHTASGGLHAYFAKPERELRCSAGLIGLAELRTQHLHARC
jgi:putative DNA primase/helicase